MSNEPPKRPWVTGRHSSYAAFKLTLTVCQDEHGNVWSEHDFASPQDQDVAQKLPQGGAPQIAHALLTEAVRREAFMCALIELTKDPNFLTKYKDFDEAAKARVDTEIRRYTNHVITRTMGKMTPVAVAGVLSMMVDQNCGDPDTDVSGNNN